MAKQTGWIHGGKYVKPKNIENNVHHRFAAASSPRRSSKQRTHSNSTTLSTLWTFTLKLLTSHVLPLIITVIQTMIALAAMTIGAVVCAVQLVRLKLASKHRQCQSPMQQQQQQQRDNRNSSGSVNAAPRNNHATEATSSSQITPPIQSRSTNQTSSALQSTTNAAATTIMMMPSSSKTTPKSLLRTTTKKSSSSSRRTSFGSKEPRTARRVLFFETSEGKVSRTEVLYDKEMPASARKEVNMLSNSKDGRGGLLAGGGVVTEGATAMNTNVAAGCSYSHNGSLGAGDSTSSTSVEKERLKNDNNTNYSIRQQASNNRSPMATTLVHQHTLNKITVPLNNNNNNNSKPSSSSSIPPTMNNSTSTSPLATLTNKRPRDETNTTTTAVRDVISKRRNLIAVSRYNSKQPYPKTRPVYNNTIGSNNTYITKRRREEIIWNVMNKKNKYENAVENTEENENTGKEGLLLRDTDTTIALGKTPMKARPTN
eukprot:scaffold42679_cov35-Cyclotella_meneghiniana.AAC.3